MTTHPGAKLVVRGPKGYARVAWSDYLFLRDRVQRHLENGVQSERFATLHALERAASARFQLVEAARLRAEVLEAWRALRELEPLHGAIGADTSSQVDAGRFLRVVLAATEGVSDREKLLVAFEQGQVP